MSVAVIKTGGKQYLASVGDTFQIEKIAGEIGDVVAFDEVLGVFSESDFKAGSPNLAGANVKATIVNQGRGRKIEVLKYRAKSKYRRKIGHRQAFTEIKIDSVNA